MSLCRLDEAYQASRQLLSMAGLKCRQHRLQLPLTLQEMELDSTITDKTDSEGPISKP